MATKDYSKCNELLVAAFDFGTTYSGYAFSFRDDPMKIQTNQGWNAGSEKLISLKTPTCVLLNPNKEFDTFGFEAENKYASLAEDDKHYGWLLFRRFKMLLHNNQGLSREATVEDINGKSMPALSVFAMSIRYLREHLLNALNTQLLGVSESDIKYVLTVPAIWSDRAKQFMREAALMAGMDSERLKLALEPEAASVWCQTIPTEIGASLAGPGTQYMVVDLGGGTADISVHEKKPDGSLKQLHRASGGPWGGNAVDQNYIAWLTKIFGEVAMKRFRGEQMTDFFDLQREFETKKRTVKSNTEGKITFRVSASLRELYQELNGQTIKEKLSTLGIGDSVVCSGDKLRVDASIVKSWFQDPIDNTISHIKKVFAEPGTNKVMIILLVGGFGECEMIQAEIKKKIQNRRVIVPDEAGLAVLKGAVRFGHFPDLVSTRVAPRSYGLRIKVPFDPKIHPSSRIVVVNGEKMVDDIFSKFVSLGEEIPSGHEVKRKYTPVYPTATGLAIFTSDKAETRFVDEPGCQEIGFMTVNHPGDEPLEDKAFEVAYFFGDTELHVTITMLKSKNTIKTTIDCL